LIKKHAAKRKTGRKKTRGKPPFEPAAEHRSLVETVAGFGLLHRDICLLIVNPHTGKPVSEPTLRKNFKAELAVGAVKANAKVVQSLYQQATTKGNVTAAIWWTKCRMGWKETVRTEVAGKVRISDARKRIAAKIAEIVSRRDGLAAGSGSGGDPGEADDERG
jgi:hypothetical protein